MNKNYHLFDHKDRKISFINDRGEKITVGKPKQKIISMNTSRAVIHGSNKPQEVIYFSFNHGSDYPIGYWRNKLRRDMAFRYILSESRKDSAIIHFKYKEWFKPASVREEVLLKEIGNVTFRDAMKLIGSSISETEFTNKVNSIALTNTAYNKDVVKALLKGQILANAGINQKELTLRMSLLFPAPVALIKKGIDTELFWLKLINNTKLSA